ncbi:hypothetical protein ACTJIJ_17995 [Niabella sp. 22666]|uniref:hypothetical protein n=1 Tax=Niabella sp. 22666 TaxID=3453954 RepID=UPI003F857799
MKKITPIKSLASKFFAVAPQLTRKIVSNAQGLALFFVSLVLVSSSLSAQTPNLHVPIRNGSGPFTAANLTARSSALLGPLLPDFNNVGNLEDNNTANAATIGLTGILGAWVEIDYSGGTFPQGSEVGFTITNGLLSASLFGGISITTYSTASGESGVVSTSGAGQLIGASLLGGTERISFVSTGAGSFRRVRLNFSGINLGVLTSILGAGATISVYGADVLVPQAGTLPSTCNSITQLNQAAFPAVASYGTTGVVGGGGLAAADVAGILSQIQDVANVTTSSTGDYARLSPINASVAGDGFLSVKLLSGSVPKDYYAGFEIENLGGGLLSNVNLLNGMSIQALNNGAVVQTMSAYQILSASILGGGGVGRQTIGFLVTNGPFNEVRMVFTSGLLSLGASLGETRIYNAVVRNFCPPSSALGPTTILANGHASANGLGVSVNGGNSGLANASLLNTQALANSMNNLIDNDASTYVSLSSTLGIGAANAASVSVTTPAYTFVNDEYTGFVVKAAAPLANVGLLTGVTVSTYLDGALQEESSVSNNLLKLNVLNALSINGAVPPDAQLVYFKTTNDFDEVKLTVNDLVGIGSELQVYSAFVSGQAVLPVNFGEVNAVYQNGKLSLNWSTLSETNNKEFIVEGSVDGKTWTKLGAVASKASDGNSDTSIQYDFSKSVQELIALSGFSLLSMILLAGLALLMFPSIKRKSAFMLTPILAIFMTLTLFACSKSDNAPEIGEKPVTYIRIAQVDKDGSTSYSKVVKVVYR